MNSADETRSLSGNDLASLPGNNRKSDRWRSLARAAMMTSNAAEPPSASKAHGIGRSRTPDGKQEMESEKPNLKGKICVP